MRDFNESIGHALAALSGLTMMWLAAHPEALDNAVYRLRLWRAYHPRHINTARLRHLRALRWAGAFDDDLHAEESTS